MKFDALVVGGGIAGMESSLKLADMGYSVALVERQASVGGRMILLSKVFPTLDCASCISGPKMSSTVNHPNITTFTTSEVEGIRRQSDGTFAATVRQRAKYVDWSACTGCQDCEVACTVAVPDQFNYDLAARRAAYIAFPQAVPKKAVLERAGTSPCTDACPAGIKAHGYVALIRDGRYEEAFQLILEATPLVATLGRACYAPCEESCTRGDLEGTLPIRRLKRFVADWHYATYDGPGVEPAAPTGQRVAVVGSGPAGLTAAWQLARRGHAVTIFEAAHEPGGFLRYALPEYRLPRAAVDQDIANVTALGVEIVVDHPVDDVAGLRDAGYDAVVVATGTPLAQSLHIPGEQHAGVTSGLAFLRAVREGKSWDLSGRTVVVVGGGNVAMDAARTARRLGAAVTVVYRRSRGEMPANHVEAEDAEQEGVSFAFLLAPAEVVADAAGHASAVRCQEMRLGPPDASGRRRPEAIPGAERVVACDLVISAIGLRPDGDAFAALSHDGSGALVADPTTLATALPGVFVAGDAVTGPSDITRAVGQGRRAAHMLDRWLRGEPLDGFHALDDRLAVVDHAAVLARQRTHSRRDPAVSGIDFSVTPHDFAELEPALTEVEALDGVARCLDCGVCSECGACSRVCPADAIHLEQHDEMLDLEVDTVVVATGYELFDAYQKPEYGYGTFPNVITATEMDRLLAPTRPFNTVLRPSDGKVPERVAYVSCVGSRDRTVDNPLCSKICCMYSIKQHQLIMGALPLADVTTHYMDMRAAGKRYEEFFSQGKDMGATYIKGRVAKIEEKDNGDLRVFYEDIENGGRVVEAEYDLVVLSVGVRPNPDALHLFDEEDLAASEFRFVAEPAGDHSPGRTSIPGVYVAGASSGAKDIVDSIMHAGAAVAQAAATLEVAHPRRRVPLEVH